MIKLILAFSIVQAAISPFPSSIELAQIDHPIDREVLAIGSEEILFNKVPLGLTDLITHQQAIRELLAAARTTEKNAFATTQCRHAEMELTLREGKEKKIRGCPQDPLMIQASNLFRLLNKTTVSR